MKKLALKLAALTAAFAIGAFALAACAPKADFVVGFDAEYPPYGYMADDGSYTGFDLELAEKVAEINGWAFRAEPIDWDSKDGLLNSGQITCIWNGFTYEGREDLYAWSDPYMLNSQVIVVKAGSTITNNAGLAGKNVLTQAGSSAEELLSEGGDEAELGATFTLRNVADYNNAFNQLNSAQVDAVACDYSIFAYQNSANPGRYVILSTLSSEHYAVGFKLGNEAMAEQVNAALKQLDEDGWIEALCEKYASQGISYTNWCLE